MKTARVAITVLLAAFIAACGGDEQTATFNWENTELAYSYPYQGQEAVPLGAPVVLYFSDPLDADEDEILEQVVLYRLDGEDEVEMELEVLAVHEEHDSGITSAVLRPDAEAEGSWKLDPATDYRVTLGSLSSELGDVGVPEQGISFRTRGETEAARSRMGDDSFYVTRIMPDGNDFRVMDFSTLRVQFSQPVDRDSLRYGEDGSLALLDENDAVVPARVYLKGHFLTVAPKEELEPGREYRLEQRNDGLSSVHGESLGSGNLPFPLATEEDPPLHTFTPGNTRPRATMVQEARSSEDDDSLVSRLTGEVINAVPVTAVLLGPPDEDNTSYQQGDVFAELGHVPSHPDSTPLRVPRGNLLKGSSLEVKVAGEVPAGFETGDISVTFINDAVGYMIPNELQRNRANKDMPRHVRLVMDIAMNAEDPEANAALSQDLMHVELAGIAKVRDGVMEIDAVGVVEPEVLGLETATGLLSFNMVAYEDQKKAPMMVEDTVSPELQSWTLDEEHQDKARPGDPLILNFTRPLDPDSLEHDNAVTLYREGQALTGDALRTRIDGTSLVVEPRDEGLEHNVEYELVLSDDMKGVNGQPVTVPGGPLEFSLPHHPDVDQRSPLVMTAYPGFPCPTDGDWNFTGDENEHQGRCAGGRPSDNDRPDDLLPVPGLPANRPIDVQFSRTMDRNSVRQTLTVERSPDDGSTWEEVDGRVKAERRRARFFPDEAWEEGVLYRYTLASEPSGVDCGVNAKCSEEGHPLQTRILTQSVGEGAGPREGGPDMIIHFRGGPPSESVFQVLRNLPTFDVNSDLVLQESERRELDPHPDEDPENPGRYDAPPNSTELRVKKDEDGETVTSGLMLSARVGCELGDEDDPDDDCPENKFIHLTAGLNADVVGYVEGEGVKVEIHPTMLLTTGIETHAMLGFEIFGFPIGFEEEVDTGPQVMRIRYAEDGDGRRTEPVTGWIRPGENEGDDPVFETELDLYLDAPWLEPDLFDLVALEHNQRSYRLDGVEVRGPVTVLEDGRMLIEQRNVEPVEANVVINLTEPEEDAPGMAAMTLEIPAGGIHMLYTPVSIKD